MSHLWPLPALALAALLPWLPDVPSFWITLLNYTGISAIVSIGLVVLTGIGGMTSFGQATIMGLGAYTTAVMSKSYAMSPWLGLPAGLAVTACGALVLGAVTVRLSGHYLAVGTIAWSAALYYSFANLDFVGRNDGIPGIPPLEILGIKLIDGRASFVVIWIGVILVALATNNLLDCRAGRAIRALKGGTVAAASFGVNTARTRLLAFVYAALLAGFAGWLYAHMQRSVNPTPFGFYPSIQYLLMAVIGGAAHIPGALLGAAVVTIVNDRLQDVLPRLFGARGNYETIVFGILLIATLQWAPEGLWPHLRRLRARHRSIQSDAAPLVARAMPAQGTPVLEVTALRRTFGGLVAVNDISFSAGAGEIVGLIGPNGAGKSTTFNLITGVDTPSGGAVRFRGADISARPARAIARLGIARSFQHVKLVPTMSVIENVAIGAHLRGHAGALSGILRLDRTEDARLYAEAARQLTRVGLAEVADRPATSLALGQQRIIEIARALCLDPVLLLLDEPAAGLRHNEKADLADLLRRLRAEGMTILLVEHDMDFVMGLTDRLVVMDFGTKLAEGSPEQIRTNPAVIEAYLGADA